MKNSNNESYNKQIYTIIALSIAIILGIVYLLVSGGTERIQEVLRNRKQKEEVAEVTPTPSSTPTPTPTPSATPTPTPTPEPTEEPNDADVTTNDSLTKIVNPTHYIDADYEPSDLEYVNVPSLGEFYLRKDARAACEEMFAAAMNDNIQLVLLSAYRSYAEQQYIYQQYVAEAGEAAYAQSDSIPGGTEHQLGLSIDLGDYSGVCQLQTCFDELESSQWLMENSYKYGYILRHPQGMEEYTHINYNPWSYRYVGKEEAKKIFESGKSMEEFYNFE